MTEKPRDPRFPDRRVETPRVEPEIILPGEPLRRPRFDAFTETQFGQRVYVAKFGSFGFIAVALGVIVVVALALILLVGALLFWIPVIALLGGAAILARLWQRRGR